MRIIAGSLGGRVFDAPGTRRTHPMSDRVRGALFNVLGDIEGLAILDAFSGSGALGFEAISRGASQVICIEHDRAAQLAIERNIKALDVSENIKLIKATASAWLNTNLEVAFDIVLCDPPYDDLQISLLNRLAERVNVGGLVVLSLPPKDPFTLLAESYELQVAKDYGDAKLVFYRRIG